MKTISEIRRANLLTLIDRAGTIADLNESIGLDRTDATLSQIKNRSPHSRTGKPRSMGDDLARKIEARLGLPAGWMDTPPDVFAEWIDPQLRDALGVAMRAMDSDTQYRVVRMVEAMAAAVPPSPAPTPSAPHPHG